MTKHPGGEDMTRRLLELSGLAPPCRLLDMCAGDGDTVRLLRALGYDALGLDTKGGGDVLTGDALDCPMQDASFDAVISECALYVTGDRHRALCEARRLLRPGGTLLYSDVWFDPPEEAKAALHAAGLRVSALEDATPLWREYYITRLWEDDAPELCPLGEKGKCRYYLIIAERED